MNRSVQIDTVCCRKRTDVFLCYQIQSSSVIARETNPEASGERVSRNADIHGELSVFTGRSCQHVLHPDIVHIHGHQQLVDLWDVCTGSRTCTRVCRHKLTRKKRLLPRDDAKRIAPVTLFLNREPACFHQQLMRNIQTATHRHRHGKQRHIHRGVYTDATKLAL